MPKRDDLVKKLSKKGFTTRARKGSHLGIYLMDEEGRKTGISSGVSMGGRNAELPDRLWGKISRELGMSSSQLQEYEACLRSQGWLLNKLRGEGRIRHRGA
jgi:hypothetical protein